MIPHGSVGRYRKGCRCNPCRDAKARDKADYTARRKEREAAGIPASPPGRPKIPLSQRPHGDYVTYCKGCRCRPCSAAWRERRPSYQAKYGHDDTPEVAVLRERAAELGYEIHKKRTPTVVVG